MNKSALSLLGLSVFLAKASFAADLPPSLFFTPEEAKQIEVLAEQRAREDASGSDIHLGAVMYYGPQDWTLWLRGEAWTPATERADLRVLDVGPGEAKLAWTDTSNAEVQEITLRPHQTYQTLTGKIIEESR
ncbi:MAG: hypothetical protein SFW62_08435 [Alphaproteobacteria bacterium]|nr:hypothetical protein [Alphaproteobacteria bacterium]